MNNFTFGRLQLRWTGKELTEIRHRAVAYGWRGGRKDGDVIQWLAARAPYCIDEYEADKAAAKQRKIPPEWTKRVDVSRVSTWDPEPAIRAYEVQLEDQRKTDKLASEIVKAGYKNLAKKFHPDIAGGSHEDFVRLKKAAEQLRRRGAE